MNADNAIKSALKVTVGGIILFLFITLFYGPVPWLLVLVVWVVVATTAYPFLYVHICKVEFDPPDYLIRLAYQ